MKLKYYLRGLGIGIIVTTVILMISFSLNKNELSDEQIIARAEALGMEFPEDKLFPEEETESEMTEEQTETDGNETETDTTEISVVTEEAVGEQESESQMTDEASGDVSAETPDGEAVTGEMEPYLLTIKPGAVCRNVCEELYANGLVDDAEAFRKYLGSVGYASSMTVGNYYIPYGLGYEEIYNILSAGPVEE